MATTARKKTTRKKTVRKNTATKGKVCRNCGRKMPAAKKPAARKPATKKTATRKPAAKKTASKAKGKQETLKSVPPRAARYVVTDGKKQFQTSSRTVAAAKKKVADLQEKNPRKKFTIYDIKGA